MLAGLQIWNENSVSILDTTTFVGRLISIIDASAASGSVSFTNVTGILFAIPILDTGSGTQTYSSVSLPIVTINGYTISWTRQAPASGSTPTCQLIIGVR